MADNEYRGRNARVRVEGDELLFSQGGRVARVVTGPTDWRIPIACIREVVFKDAKLATGLLHFVIGDAESPKANIRGLVGKRWTIEFQAGKQAKAMRGLHDVVQEHIARNRQDGVDPTTARQPYADGAGAKALHDMKQKALGDTLIERPHQSATTAEVIETAKRGPAYSQFYSDLDSLAQRLRADETLRLLSLGMNGLTPVLLAVSDQRVLVHADNATAKVRDELPLPVHASWKSSLVSSVLTFRAGHHELQVGAISDTVADKFLEALD